MRAVHLTAALAGIAAFTVVAVACPGTTRAPALQQSAASSASLDSVSIKSQAQLRPRCAPSRAAGNVDSTTLVTIYEEPCTDSVTLSGMILLQKGPSKVHLIVLSSYTMFVSHPISETGESALNMAAMSKRAVPLLPLATRLVLDTTLVVDSAETVKVPASTESVWKLSPLILQGQGDWVPVRICAELVAVASIKNGIQESAIANLARSKGESCLQFGIRPE